MVSLDERNILGFLRSLKDLFCLHVNGRKCEIPSQLSFCWEFGFSAWEVRIYIPLTMQDLGEFFFFSLLKDKNAHIPYTFINNALNIYFYFFMPLIIWLLFYY
jgi:hypothetical protein